MIIIIKTYKQRGSWYRDEATGWMVEESGFDIFLFSHNVQVTCGAHPASYALGTRGCLPRDTAEGT
jgi:hypothetical protein